MTSTSLFFHWAFIKTLNNGIIKIYPLIDNLNEADKYADNFNYVFQNLKIDFTSDDFVTIDGNLFSLVYMLNEYKYDNLTKIHSNYKKKKRKKFKWFGKEIEYVEEGKYFPNFKNTKSERVVQKFHKSYLFLDYTAMKEIQKKEGAKK